MISCISDNMKRLMMLASSWSWPLILSSNANVDGSFGGGDATALELVRRARRHEDGQQLVCNVSHHFLRFLGSRCRSSWMVFVLLRRRRTVRRRHPSWSHHLALFGYGYDVIAYCTDFFPPFRTSFKNSDKKFFPGTYRYP